MPVDGASADLDDEGGFTGTVAAYAAVPSIATLRRLIEGNVTGRWAPVEGTSAPRTRDVDVREDEPGDLANHNCSCGSAQQTIERRGSTVRRSAIPLFVHGPA